MTLPKLHITSFSFENHDIRTVIINGEPWFIAQDICIALQVQNVTQAIERLDDDERSMFNIGRQGKANIISESGMYTLVLRCRDAVKQGTVPHRFRKWVTKEVLPSIRKTGSYQTSKRVASTATLVTCPCCRKPAGILTIHKTHREHTEIVAVCQDSHCQKEPFKCDLIFSYYIELNKVKNNNDAKKVIDKLSYKKRLALAKLMSH